MQQGVPALNAAGCNHRIDSLANRDAAVAQRPKILRRLNRDPLPAQLDDNQRSEHSPGMVEVPLVGESLQDLGQNQVTRSEEHTSELPSLRHLVCRILL